MRRPNILWICTNQQRWDTLGCYGNSAVHTPNLDRLAESGLILDRAYCQSTACTASRASFLTGRYPSATRCRQDGQDIPEAELLLTRILADAGYACGLSGKLHLSACHPSVCPSSERRIDDGYTEFHWSHDSRDLWPCNAYCHWFREQVVEPPSESARLSPYVRGGVDATRHQTTWCVDRAITFLQQCNQFKRPWLFSVNLSAPCDPWDPSADDFSSCVNSWQESPLPSHIDGQFHGAFEKQLTGGEIAGNDPQHRPRGQTICCDQHSVGAAYWAMVDDVDAQIGRLLCAFEDSNQRDDTLVVFMADRGALLGEHGVYGQGPYLYEAAVHVPLIIAWPRTIPSGRRSPALVELVDLAPTLLQAAGIAPHPGMQGRSLWPILNDQVAPESHRDAVYCEFYGAHQAGSPGAFMTMVRSQDWKLIAFHGRNQGELYHLHTDPAEDHNLWLDPAYSEIKAAMLKRLCDRMAFGVDPLPERRASQVVWW